MMTKQQHVEYWINTAIDDWGNEIYKVCTKQFTEIQLDKVKETRKCLLEMLQ